ncbi:MAG: hypothetical protein KC550_03975, partial [Nanoarchaeota archaeon]|nr:hypothetical protein [Nanoarchaeota archaeon]
MNYIEKLSSFTNLGKKSGKNKLIKYYSKLGNPQNKLKLIHVTGTAGKGSTSAMIANGLKNAGYKVGLFTSPHLLKLNERIKINNENISDIDLNNYIKYYFEKNPNLSFSEYLTLIMISYFIEKEVDFVVCETFVGGKYDTTNIFANSIATIITSIGLDHENLLGNTKKKILKDKLGILRKNTPLFTRLNNEIINEKNNDGMEEEIKNEEKKNNDENINKNNPDEIFFEEYGFTAIFELINELKKPLVGHFPILDLLFIYDAFIDDLPNNYVGFVKEINKIFPVLYDTKLIAKYFENHIDIKNSLEGLYFEVFEEEKKLKPFHNVIL